MADSKELATRNNIRLFSIDEAKKAIAENRTNREKVRVIISRTLHIRKPDQEAIERTLPLAMSVGITRVGSIITAGLQTERHGYTGTIDVIEEASIGEIDPSVKMGGVRFYPGGGVVSVEEVDPAEIKQYLLGAREQNRLENNGEFISEDNQASPLQTQTLTTLHEIEQVVPLEGIRVIEINAFIPEEERPTIEQPSFQTQPPPASPAQPLAQEPVVQNQPSNGIIDVNWAARGLFSSEDKKAA